MYYDWGTFYEYIRLFILIDFFFRIFCPYVVIVLSRIIVVNRNIFNCGTVVFAQESMLVKFARLPIMFCT